MNQIEKNKYHETKSHSSEEFLFNTYPCSIPTDFPSVPLHWHNDMELIVIKHGSAKVTLNLTPHQLSAGDILVVLPENLHSIDCAIGDKLEYENIIFKKELLSFATNDITMSKYLTPFFNGDFPIVTHVHMGYSFYSHFVKIINTMDVLCDKKEFGYQLAIKSCLLELIHIMIRHPPKTEENKKSEKSVDKIKEILTYMEQHYTEEISIEKIAEICHYSPSHFMKFFKNHMGTSFIKYLNDFRLIKARTRILTTEESILEIAGDCGFNNLSHFNRQYKKKYGITPSMTRGV